MFFVTPAPITGFSEARPWALSYSESPRIPLVADIEGSGESAIVSVDPGGDGSIDVDLGAGGLKASGRFTAIDGFGKGCQAAAAGIVPGEKKATIFELLGGATIATAFNFASNKFDTNNYWVSLPGPLENGRLTVLAEGKLLAYSSSSGQAYEIELTNRSVKSCGVPRGIVWIGDEADNLVGQKTDGSVFWMDRTTLRFKGFLAKQPKGSTPAAAPGLVVLRDRYWTPAGFSNMTADPYPDAEAVLELGTTSGGERPALYEFRKSDDYHRGEIVLKRRARLASDDIQSIPAEGSESYWRDTSNDGLLDGWKTGGFRGLDLQKMGCQPGSADVICLVSRFDDVDKTGFDAGMNQIVKFYADLKVMNPDGTTGIRFHPIYLDPVSGADKNNSWQTNRDKFLPAKWRGVVHWMQVTQGGGGQSDELSNGGTCGQNALWAVFVHEFGHQLGLNHEGFFPVGACPIYTSLMNYTWSYSFEEKRDNVHYSDGTFSKLVLHENDLDETLPFPYEKVKFLSMAPYHFRMKPAGDVTLIDWNWNGVFGEKHVKATINYAYSTTAGTRDNVAKTKTAPWIFTHEKNAFVLYGTNDLPVDLKVQPTLSAQRPGRLLLKQMISPTKWAKEWTIEPDGLAGDPVAASIGGKIVCVYPTVTGLQLKMISVEDKQVVSGKPFTLSTDPSLVPTIGIFDRRCYVFDWNPTSHEVGYRIVNSRGVASARQTLSVPSSNPVGICTDTIDHQGILAMAQDQPEGKTNRWQVRKFYADPHGTLLVDPTPEWIQGEGGGARGTGRLTVLFDSSRDAGPKGRIYLYGKGITDDKSPWACSYVAQQIADKSYNGGWIVKRFYDEWSQTRSAPAAAWFGNDILFAYRWTAGDQSETDNDFHLGYHGLGIEPGPMSDFDDLSYIRNFGLANSLLELGEAK